MEKDIEKKLVKGIQELGGQAYKFTSPGHDGMPDRLIVLPNGNIVFTELKTERGVLSRLQAARLDELRRLGCNALVLKGEREVTDFLEEMKCSLNRTHTNSTR